MVAPALDTDCCLDYMSIIHRNVNTKYITPAILVICIGSLNKPQTLPGMRVT